MSMAVGTVRWFSGRLGYGFIERDDGKSVFVHYTALQPRRQPAVQPGERVEFDVRDTECGQQATNVNRI